MPFIPAFDLFGAPPDPTGSALFILHGILGNRNNWRSFARRLAEQLVRSRPLSPWSVVTLDQRHHGDSAARSPGPGNADSIEACADDLAALADHLGVRPAVTVGHSFGGKVVLSHAERHPAGLAQVWVLDAPPGPGSAAQLTGIDHEVVRVIAALRDVPVPLARRELVVQELLDRGLPQPLALWMTTNLGPVPGGFGFRFDLDGAERLLRSYFDWDGWPVVLAPRERPRIELVRAERSDRWDDTTLRRLAGLPVGVPTRLHLLPDAGHWLHADNPAGLLALLDAEIPAGGALGPPAVRKPRAG